MSGMKILHIARWLPIASRFSCIPLVGRLIAIASSIIFCFLGIFNLIHQIDLSFNRMLFLNLVTLFPLMLIVITVYFFVNACRVIARKNERKPQELLEAFLSISVSIAIILFFGYLYCILMYRLLGLEYFFVNLLFVLMLMWTPIRQGAVQFVEYLVIIFITIVITKTVLMCLWLLGVDHIVPTTFEETLPFFNLMNQDEPFMLMNILFILTNAWILYQASATRKIKMKVEQILKKILLG